MRKSLAFLPLSLALAAGHAFAGDGESCEWHKSASAQKTSQAAPVQSKAIAADNAQCKPGEAAMFPEIQREDLAKAVEAKQVFLVDANGTESYRQGHIPGAIDFQGAGDAFAKRLPADKHALIVAYCGGPGCQAWCKAADKLHQLGYTNVKHYKGGLKGWKTAGLTLEKADKQG